jgi:hypothetical protein
MLDTNPKTRSARLVATALAFALMVTALLYLFLGDTAVAQEWRMRRARRHQDVIEKVLEGDGRFGKVKMSVCPASGGASLMVHGTVAADADLQSLQEIVRSTSPPCPVQFRLVVVR